MKKRTAVSFSGKDSTLALHDLIHSDEYEVEWLFSTVTEGFNRTSIHGVRVELLEAQAASIGLPLFKIFIPENCSNEQYQARMNEGLIELKNKGITDIAFGDLFLEDVRAYREELLKPLELKLIFPIWKENTRDAIQRFISLGYHTVITCVDLTQLPEEFSGKEIDHALLKQFPEGVDPCGENGEFHSFVFNGPIFQRSIEFVLGEKKISPDVFTGQPRFCFTDLIPI